jgi:hypothetical protein
MHASFQSIGGRLQKGSSRTAAGPVAAKDRAQAERVEGGGSELLARC